MSETTEGLEPGQPGGGPTLDPSTGEILDEGALGEEPITGERLQQFQEGEEPEITVGEEREMAGGPTGGAVTTRETSEGIGVQDSEPPRGGVGDTGGHEQDPGGQAAGGQHGG
jgi:hypothetical protein